jgi:hypothetical protein
MQPVNYALEVYMPDSDGVEIHQVEQLNNRMPKALNAGS